MNAITQQMKNQDKNEMKKESKSVFYQIINSEQVNRRVSRVYNNIDQKEYKVYQMDN